MRSDNDNKEIMWSFVMPGTGQDIVKNREEAIADAENLSDIFYSESTELFSDKYQVLKNILREKQNKLLSDNNSNAFLLLQEILLFRSVVMEFINKQPNSAKFFMKENFIPLFSDHIYLGFLLKRNTITNKPYGITICPSTPLVNSGRNF
jgi:hypothetical protein